MNSKTKVDSKKITSFDQIRKNKLDKLHDAFDRSKKGSLDAPIVDLIHYINTLDNFVTTSSCSGRFAIFCAKYIEEKDSQISKGGKWLFVEHRTVTYEEIDNVYDNELKKCRGVVLFKLEPFVLHVECRTIEDAQEMLSLAIQCGFRESGILAGKKIMLGIRTTSNNLELPIYENGNIGISKEYLHYLVDYGNKKFNNNLDRIHLFYSTLQQHFSSLSTNESCVSTLSSSIPMSPSQWKWNDLQSILSTSESIQLVCQQELDDLLRRKAHLSCNINDDMICIYGGWGGKKHAKDTILSDVIYIQKKANQVLIHSPSFAVSPPSRQFSSISSFKFHSSKTNSMIESLVLFGGRSGLNHIYNDCWILNIHTNEWTMIQCQGPAPCCRWYSSLCSLSSTTLLLYGGRDETTIYGDCWELTVVEKEDGFHGTWTLLYNYNDSQYIEDIQTSTECKDPRGPGCLFMHTMIPICASSKGSCNHDHVLIFGGYNNLEGYHTSNSMYVFKVSKRYWCDVNIIENEVYRRNRKRKQRESTVVEDMMLTRDVLMTQVDQEPSNTEDESMEKTVDSTTKEPAKDSNKRVHDENDNENPSYRDMILMKSVYLCTNTYILYGYINEKFKCYLLDLSSFQSNQSISLYPFPSLEISLSQYLQSNVVLVQFSLNILNNMLFLSGGGCNSFFTTRYNHSIYSFIPDSLYQYITTHSTCSLLQSNIQTITIEEKKPTIETTPTRQSFQLLISDKTKLKTIKTLLEEHHLYDKSRKIQSKENQFLIPLLLDSEEDLPEAIKQIAEMTIVKDESSNEPPLPSPSDRIQRLNDSIRHYCHSSKITLSFELPTKYEFIQDLILFPKQFDTLFSIPVEHSPLEELYQSILSLLNLKRIAVYHDIDGGPVRQSHTTVVYPLHADPWITIKQNGILYSYNIEQVMYSKGNCTERLRMKQLPMAPHEFVVDMYSGIGYFTLPILSHSECQHLVALEWNPNSVEALKKNLLLNHFEDKCTVLLGDNRVTAVPYYHKADRVLLGLLPTSKPGWKTALLLLKPQGGYLHLHENVHDLEYDQFESTLPVQLHQLSLTLQKPFSFTIEHVERVKSYAPHVYHYVFDLHANQE